MATNSIGRAMEYWTLTFTSAHTFKNTVDASLYTAVATAQAAYDLAIKTGAGTTELATLNTAKAALATGEAAAVEGGVQRARAIEAVSMRGQPIILGDWNGKIVKFAVDTAGSWTTASGAKNNLLDAVARSHAPIAGVATPLAATAVSTVSL